MTMADCSSWEYGPSCLACGAFGKIFQNLSVSSPAPVTMFSPSGDIAKYSTLRLCPVRVANLRMDGYFHTMIALSEYPWVLTNSLLFLLKTRLHT